MDFLKNKNKKNNQRCGGVKRLPYLEKKSIVFAILFWSYRSALINGNGDWKWVEMGTVPNSKNFRHRTKCKRSWLTANYIFQKNQWFFWNNIIAGRGLCVTSRWLGTYRKIFSKKFSKKYCIFFYLMIIYLQVKNTVNKEIQKNQFTIEKILDSL